MAIAHRLVIFALVNIIRPVFLNMAYTPLSPNVPAPLPSQMETPKLCPMNEDYEYDVYSYNPRHPYGPEKWFKVRNTATCFKGLNQSPVTVNTSSVIPVCGPFNNLHYDKSDEIFGEFHNTGYYAEYQDIAEAPKLLGVPGFWYEGFELDSIQIHYDRKGGSRGTEHVITGKKYDAELQILHIRKGGRGEVAGRANIAIFLSVTEGENNTELNSLMDWVKSVRLYQEDVDIPLSSEKLLPKKRQYYYYYGSMTTPTNSESVIWMIMLEPLKISAKYLRDLQAVETRKAGVPISRVGNLRPLQDLNGRPIFINSCVS